MENKYLSILGFCILLIATIYLIANLFFDIIISLDFWGWVGIMIYCIIIVVPSIIWLKNNDLLFISLLDLIACLIIYQNIQTPFVYIPLIIFIIIVTTYGIFNSLGKEKTRTYTTVCPFCRRQFKYRSTGTPLDDGRMRMRQESLKNGGDGRLKLECPHCHKNIW